MNIKNRDDLASAFGVPHQIVPFIPELLAGLWSLSVPPELIVELFRPLNLPPRTTRVLDLGCGKGAVSITLARQLGFSVDGIDFFPPFIEEARKRAEDWGLSGTCRFRVGDIRETVKGTVEYDAAIFVWVGDGLGGPYGSVGKMRRVVRPGGYMVYGEGYLKEGLTSDVNRGGHLSHGEILGELTAHGDAVVRETVLPENRTKSLYAEYIESLRKGAEKVAQEHPKHGRTLRDHIESQVQMCRTLESTVVPAVWLLSRSQP